MGTETPEWMDLGVPLAAAGALAVLWVAEWLVPMVVAARGRWRVRAANLALAGINAVVTSTVFVALTYATVGWAHAEGMGVFNALAAPTIVEWAAVLLALDLSHYLFHVSAHKIPLLWRMHAIHHHDEHVDATSATRFHAGEIAVQCLAMLPVYAVLGVSMVHILAYQLVLMPVAFFHHANIRVPEGVDRWLRLLIVTPSVHFVHHSRWQPETDSNFSSVLTLWDRLFGTFRLRRDPATIEFGLDGYTSEESASLRSMLAAPLKPAKSEYGRAPDPEHLGPPPAAREAGEGRARDGDASGSGRRVRTSGA